MSNFLGPANKLLLIGGGDLLLDVAQLGLELGLNLSVLTSERHVAARVGNKNLAECLDLLDANWVASESIEAGIELLGNDFNSDTICLSVSNPWIVTATEIEGLFGGKLLNCHGTRLPLDRGAGGFSWQIMAGNRFGIVNLYLVTEGVDSGPVIDFEEFLYPMSCRLPKDYEVVYRERLLEFLRSRIGRIVSGDWAPQLKHQPEYLSQYWPRLQTEQNGWIAWDQGADEIYRFICAFDAPYGGARTTWNNEVVVARDCLLNLSDGQFHPFQSGIVYRKSDEWLCVAASNGNLVVSSLCDLEGNSVLGNVKVGDRLSTPRELVDDSRARFRLSHGGWTETA